jgi:hypothetical protein
MGMLDDRNALSPHLCQTDSDREGPLMHMDHIGKDGVHRASKRDGRSHDAHRRTMPTGERRERKRLTLYLRPPFADGGGRRAHRMTRASLMRREVEHHALGAAGADVVVDVQDPHSAGLSRPEADVNVGFRDSAEQFEQ